MSGAEAACSVRGSPAGWRNESGLPDFHELRQDFSPPNPCTEDCTTCGREAVKSVLRLFDELVKCDEEGVLKGVREVIEGF